MRRVDGSRDRAVAAALKNGGYIVGPLYDWFFFILSPLFGVGIAWASLRSGAGQLFMWYRDPAGAMQRLFLIATLSQILTNAHLVIVVLRSHANGKIFRLYPWRFTLVPLVIWLAAVWSKWIFVLTGFVAFWWDDYHSALQTFGLGRIYDQRAGNDATVGRTADYLINLVIYLGPLLAGVNLAMQLGSFDQFRALDAAALVRIGQLLFERREGLQLAIVPIGAVSLVIYLLYYARLARRGPYRVPLPKLALFTVTAFVSVAAWGFGSFGDSVLIMNFFHAFQYFALVWWSEKGHLSRLLFGQKALALLALLGLGFWFGYFRTNPVQTYLPYLAFGNVVALMHFWYDGFIWSVRKGQV